MNTNNKTISCILKSRLLNFFSSFSPNTNASLFQLQQMTSSTQKYLLFYIGQMGCEVVPAVLVSFLPEFRIVSDTISNARTGHLVAESLTPSVEKIFFIGTYWNDAMEAILMISPKFECIIISNGQVRASFPSRVRVMNGEIANMGPINMLLKLLQEYNISTPLFEAFVLTPDIKQIIRFSDERILNINMEENQMFYSGLFADRSLNGDLFNRVFQLMKGTSTIQNVLQVGENSVFLQKTMCRERIINNSVEISFDELSTPTQTRRIRFTSASELINLTHDQMKQMYPDLDYTAVVALKFGPTGCEYKYSIRALKSDCNALTLMESLNGGGSRVSAGCAVPFVLPLPWVSQTPQIICAQ